MQFASPFEDLAPALLLAVFPMLAYLRSIAGSAVLRWILNIALALDLVLGAAFFLFPHNHHWTWFLNGSNSSQWAMDAAVGGFWIAGSSALLVSILRRRSQRGAS